MTHTKRLHIVPGFDQESSTKTMFLLVLELPGGLVEANPILNEDLMGAKIQFVELGQALDAGYLLRDIAGRPGRQWPENAGRGSRTHAFCCLRGAGPDRAREALSGPPRKPCPWKPA